MLQQLNRSALLGRTQRIQHRGFCDKDWEVNQKKKGMKTESSVPGVCQTHSALLQGYHLEKENPTFCSGTAPLSTAQAPGSILMFYLCFQSFPKGSDEDIKRKSTLSCPDVQQSVPLLCSRKDTPFLPILMAIFSGKSISWCWNLLSLLPHLPVAKDPE